MQVPLRDHIRALLNAKREGVGTMVHKLLLEERFYIKGGNVQGMYENFPLFSLLVPHEEE